MKYISNNKNKNNKSKRINQLEKLDDLTNDTLILVHNEEYGTCKIQLEDLISLLDLRYQLREEVSSNQFIEAISKVFIHDKYIENDKEEVEDDEDIEEENPDEEVDTEIAPII